MRCTYPKTVGFMADGKTISWSQKHYSKEFATFQLPCGKCLQCRLEYARSWAIRCTHEAQMHENNCFVTLTYSDENLKSDKLIEADFDRFVQKLRDKIKYDLVKKYGGRKLWNKLPAETRKAFYEKVKIGIYGVGEYGEQKKRPHWHACIFNWSPEDYEYKYTTDRGDIVYSSATLTALWDNKGTTEFGSVTFDSAGYCARYAAKKLVHGHDGAHGYEPIPKKSLHQAPGKSFLEKYWRDIFNEGVVRLSNGRTSSIPRYYEKWLKVKHPKEWQRYVTQTKQRKIDNAVSQANALASAERIQNEVRRDKHGIYYAPQTTRLQATQQILDQKFKLLQQKLKL